MAKFKTVTVRHRGRVGTRYFHDANNDRVFLNPGEVREGVEVTDAEYDRLIDYSKNNIGDIEVSGHQGDEPEEDEEQMSRAELEKLERRNLDTASRRQLERRSTDEGEKARSSRRETEEQDVGGFADMTKEQLQDEARERGLPVSGNKSELIDAIEAHDKKNNKR